MGNFNNVIRGLKIFEKHFKNHGLTEVAALDVDPESTFGKILIRGKYEQEDFSMEDQAELMESFWYWDVDEKCWCYLC